MIEPIRPMLCQEARIDQLTSREWALEGKWDGYRLLLASADGEIILFSRSGRDVTGEFRALARQLSVLLRNNNVVLDGEAVALDDDGVPQFNAIQLHRRWPRVEFWAFDILELDGSSTLRFSYDDRRRLLEKFAELTGINVPELIPCGDGATAMQYSKEQGWEGVVAKRRDSFYDEGRRSTVWLKDKHWEEREVVICGWTPGKGHRADKIGSLLMGVPSEDGLQFVGRVGTGFNDADLAFLKELLTPLTIDESPFTTPIPSAEHRIATYVRPEVIGEVRYGLQTDDGRLRFPSWRGLRTDKTLGTMN